MKIFPTFHWGTTMLNQKQQYYKTLLFNFISLFNIQIFFHARSAQYIFWSKHMLKHHLPRFATEELTKIWKNITRVILIFRFTVFYVSGNSVARFHYLSAYSAARFHYLSAYSAAQFHYVFGYSVAKFHVYRLKVPHNFILGRVSVQHFFLVFGTNWFNDDRGPKVQHLFILFILPQRLSFSPLPSPWLRHIKHGARQTSQSQCETFRKPHSEYRFLRHDTH